MSIEDAVEALRRGELVAFPTETVYGLGADAANPQAVARVFAAKGRPHFNPLIAHVLGLADAERHAALHPRARALAERFWPGPLTLVAPRRAESTVCELACAGLRTIALRAPSHRIARELIEEFGGPIVAPSANKSGHVSATTAAHVIADLGNAVDMVLDGGAAGIGLEFHHRRRRRRAGAPRFFAPAPSRAMNWSRSPVRWRRRAGQSMRLG